MPADPAPREAAKRGHSPAATFPNNIVRKQPRERFRGLPPMPSFDFDQLGAGQLLTEKETAAVLRRSISTLSNWRQLTDHPLQYRRVHGRIFYTAAAIRSFIAGDADQPATDDSDAKPRKAKVRVK